MLIQFSVENFRVFRDRQSFTMETSKSSKSIEANNVIPTNFKVAPYILKQACFFGANGAGKSTLVDAMVYMSNFVVNSLKETDQDKITVEQFGIDEEESRQPTSFEVEFIVNETLYIYGFALTKERVQEEWLVSRSVATQRLRNNFHRSYDKESKTFNWDINSSLVAGEKGYWRTLTRPDALFLSTAVQFDNSGFEDVFKWFLSKIRFLNLSNGFQPFVTARLIEHKEGWKQKFIELVNSIGIKLSDINVSEIDYLESPEFKQLPKTLQEIIMKTNPGGKSFLINFIRERNDEKRLILPLESESAGIQAIFSLAGPILETLQEGYILCVDEFNTNLHPLAFRKIISMFNDPTINKNNAQLIFTSHDVTITEDDMIERDHIWLIEKKPNLTSELYPLSKFRKRRNKAFKDDYLKGRYGAIPVII